MKKTAYLMASFPVLSETFVSTEIRAMRKLGHEVIPFAFCRHDGPYQSCDEDLKRQTHYLEDLSKVKVLGALTALRPSVTKAIAFALEQQGLTTRSLLLSSLKLAALIKKTGCDHIHAHFAQATAATAITAAKCVVLQYLLSAMDTMFTPRPATYR